MIHRRHQLSAAAAISLLGLASLLLYLYWHVLVSAALLFVAVRLAWAITAQKAGLKRRRKSSWSSLGRTAALMYAAWNSRWLKPTSSVKTSIPATVGAIDHPDPFGDFPEGY